MNNSESANSTAISSNNAFNYGLGDQNSNNRQNTPDPNDVYSFMNNDRYDNFDYLYDQNDAASHQQSASSNSFSEQGTRYTTPDASAPIKQETYQPSLYEENSLKMFDYVPPFDVTVENVIRTMNGINKILGIELESFDITEDSIAEFNPEVKPEKSDKRHETSKNESAHSRLISDACAFIIANVSRAVLAAHKDSVYEQYNTNAAEIRPVAPFKKNRRGILGFKDLAARANLSPWHFHRVFRFVTGVTPKIYGESAWEYLLLEHNFELKPDEELLLDNYRKGKKTNKSADDSAIKQETAVLEPEASVPVAQTVASHHRADSMNQRGRTGPISGVVRAGRVQKSGSLSRGASSRSRSRQPLQVPPTPNMNRYSSQEPEEERGRSHNRAFGRARAFSALNQERPIRLPRTSSSVGPKMHSHDFFENPLEFEEDLSPSSRPQSGTVPTNFQEPPDINPLSIQHPLNDHTNDFNLNADAFSSNGAFDLNGVDFNAPRDSFSLPDFGSTDFSHYDSMPTSFADTHTPNTAPSNHPAPPIGQFPPGTTKQHNTNDSTSISVTPQSITSSNNRQDLQSPSHSYNNARKPADQFKYNEEHYETPASFNNRYENNGSTYEDQYHEDNYSQSFNSKSTLGNYGMFNNEFNLDNSTSNPVKIDSVDELPTSFYLSNEDRQFLDQPNNKPFENLGDQLKNPYDNWSENNDPLSYAF